jgi:enamine deaminase RidA (YjgF/YER057c/UK114 family)
VPIDSLYDPAYRVEITTIAIAEDRMDRTALPAEAGDPFAPAIRAGDHVFISGQHGVAPGGDDAFAAQAARAFDRVLDCVRRLGGSADDVVATHIYTARELTGDELQALAEVHRVRFADGANRPTSNLIGVRRLRHPDALVEVTGIAVVGGDA